MPDDTRALFNRHARTRSCKAVNGYCQLFSPTGTGTDGRGCLIVGRLSARRVRAVTVDHAAIIVGRGGRGFSFFYFGRDAGRMRGEGGERDEVEN